MAISGSEPRPGAAPIFAIVLGASVWPGGKPSPALQRRAEAAAALYASGKVTGVIASGGLGPHPPSEAAVIRDVLAENGVPETAVLLDEAAANTYENLVNAQQILPDGAGAVIVSDLWHLPRARLVARRIELKATTAPASLKGAHPRRVARAVLREMAAIAWYLLRPKR